MIVAGGYTGSETLNSVEAMVRPYMRASATSQQPTTRWRPLAPMKYARDHFSLCEFRGSVLAVGFVKSVESFTPPVDFSDAGQLGQWTEIQSTTSGMNVHGLVVFPEGILAAGMIGETCFNKLAIIDRFKEKASKAVVINVFVLNRFSQLGENGSKNYKGPFYSTFLSANNFILLTKGSFSCRFELFGQYTNDLPNLHLIYLITLHVI